MIENKETEKGSVGAPTETGDAAPKTYTEEEVQALIQAEGDRRVSSALKKQQKEFEAKTAEAEKLRAMDENQRKDYEYDKRLQELLAAIRKLCSQIKQVERLQAIDNFIFNQRNC